METRYESFGRIGEEVFIRWCQRHQGWLVIATCKIRDGFRAPMARGEFDRLILPDLQVFLQGRSTWVDVKTKARTTLYGKGGNVLQTGCALRHWEHYLRIEEATGIRGALGFIQCDREEIWFGYLDRIWVGSHTCSKNVEYPTIYFNVEQFDRFRLNGDELDLLAESATAPKSYQAFETHQAIVDKTISEWKQRTLDFGGGHRYK